MATVEPGVSFEQLQKAVMEKGLRVATPVELPADSSVISTLLEMTPLYSWPKYNVEHLLTMEMLLASGESVVTGAKIFPLFNEATHLVQEVLRYLD